MLMTITFGWEDYEQLFSSFSNSRFFQNKHLLVNFSVLVNFKIPKFTFENKILYIYIISSIFSGVFF